MKFDAFKFNVAMLGAVSVALLAGLVYVWYLSVREYRITIAAGSPDGESFIIAKALKDVVEKQHPRIHISVLQTGGTTANLTMLAEKQVDFAAAQADVPVPAVARSVAVLYEDHFQVIAANNSGIRGFAGLKGKRVALPRSGGQFKSFLAVADHFGLTAADFQLIGKDDRSADQAFLEGRADAVFRVRALGNPSMLKLARSGVGYFVPIEHGAAMKLKYPSLQASTIPEGAYSGEPAVPAKDLASVSVQRTLLAHREADPKIVQVLTAALAEQRQQIAHAIPDELADVRPLLAGIKHPDNQTGLGAPLHPGAQDYYDRDKPSFVTEHADFFALILTVILLLGSWIWELKRFVERRQKNVADRFSHEVIALMNQAQAAPDSATLDKIRERLLAILTEAVSALDDDKLSEESFQSFRVVWQISIDVIRERRHALGMQLASF